MNSAIEALEYVKVRLRKCFSACQAIIPAKPNFAEDLFRPVQRIAALILLRLGWSSYKSPPSSFVEMFLTRPGTGDDISNIQAIE